jgi:hypothetical protein
MTPAMPFANLPAARPLALAALLLTGCAGTRPSAEPPALAANVIWEAGTKLGGVAIGELRVERAGLEIAVVSGSGELWVLSRGPEGWEAERALATEGELIQVAVGELLADRPGEELLAAGMARGSEDDPGPGATWLVARQAGGAGFEGRQVLSPSALAHAVLVADQDPTRAGLEGLSAGFDRQLSLLAPKSLEQCSTRVLANLPSDAKGMAAFDGGVALACAEGQLVWVGPGDLGYRSRQLLRTEAGLARLASGPEGLLMSSNDGRFYHVTLDSTGQAQKRELYREPGGQKGRGAAWADLGLPSGPYQNGSRGNGRSAVTAGYSGQIVALRALGRSRLETRLLHTDDAPLHHLAAGDILPEIPGDEIVAVGFSGRVLLLSRAP